MVQRTEEDPAGVNVGMGIHASAHWGGTSSTR
jgi:hypothetical protein